MLFIAPVIGQQSDAIIKRVSPDLGMSNSYVISIFQDREGFIWAITTHGLDRFDGYRFETISNTLEEPSEPGRYETLYQAQNGELWLGTMQGGILVFNDKHELIRQYKHDPDDSKSISHNWVVNFLEDSKGNLWAATYGGGLIRYISESDDFINYTHDTNDTNSIPDNLLYGLVEDNDGNFWMGTESSGLVKFNPETESFTNFRHDLNDHNYAANNGVFDVSIDDLGRIWFIEYGFGISFLDPKTNQITHYTPDSQRNNYLTSVRAYRLLCDGSKGIWIGTQDEGLFYLDFETNQFKNHKNKHNVNTSLNDNWILCLLKDKEENLWIGTDRGLNIYSFYTNQFTNYQYDPLNSNTISDNNVNRLEEDAKGQLWVGTGNDGLSIINKERTKVSRYKADPQRIGSLSDNHITKIYRDNNNQMFICTRYGGVNVFEPTTKTFKSIPTISDKGNGTMSTWIDDIVQDNQGRYWMGTPGGISMMDASMKKFKHWSSRDSADYFIDSEFLMKVFLDEQDQIWTYDQRQLQWFKINTKKNVSEKVAITGAPFLQEGKNILWTHLPSALRKYNLATEEFIDYPTNEFFPSGLPINNLHKDNSGNYWISSERGIWLWNPEAKTAVNYTQSDGLSEGAIYHPGFSSTHSGYVYFFGSNGISSIKPDELKANPFVPPVVISGISYHSSLSEENVAIPVQGISSMDSITFPYHYNILNIEYAALSYSKTDKNQYAYKIEGLSDNWIEQGAENKLTLTNLDPKTYTLNIRGSTGDGVWNETNTKLKITITPPWWATWWAYAIYLLSLVAAIALFIKWRTKAHKQKLLEEQKVVERLKQVDKLKDQFLANTSHELRTPLNGIIGLSESLIDGAAGPLDSRVVRNLDMIATSGRRLSNLVNDILDFSKLKNKDLNLKYQPLDLYAAVDVVLALSAPEIKAKGIEVNNNIPEDFVLVEADENRVQQILFNLIGNAIKFTESGSINIGANIDGDKIIISIKDTGIGIAKDKLAVVFNSFEQGDGESERMYGGTGLGLSISKLLIEQHGGTIQLASELNKGTTVTFSLPLSTTDRSNLLADDHSNLQINQILAPEPAVIIAEHQADEEVASTGTKKGRILVVDDEPVNRKVLENHLHLEGYIVISVVDGQSALDIIKKEEKFDLVLLDVMMPRMSGYEVAKEIRKTYLPTDLPIIMLTAKNRIQDLIAGFEAGANDYLTKPFTKGELLTRTESHIELSHIHAATSQFVPDEFLRTVGRAKITDVELGDYAEKIVTVLFTDIRDYTSLSEKMTPRNNFEFVRSYVSRMGPIIEKNHGFINQYLGDGIMAIFANDPSNALEAAIEMQREVIQYNAYRISKNRAPIRVGMGMMTGPLVMGIIGDAHRKDTTSISDTVNVAARLEGLTKLYGANIILSNDTIDALDKNHKYHIRNLGLSSVKGKENLVDIYECYDGDIPDQFVFKKEYQAPYNQAINLFMADRFNDAKILFEQIIAANPDDRVASHFVNDCKIKLAYTPLNKEQSTD